MQQFLYTFRYFCTPQDFLHFLLDRISSTLSRYAPHGPHTSGWTPGPSSADPDKEGEDGGGQGVTAAEKGASMGRRGRWLRMEGPLEGDDGGRQRVWTGTSGKTRQPPSGEGPAAHPQLRGGVLGGGWMHSGCSLNWLGALSPHLCAPSPGWKPWQSQPILVGEGLTGDTPPPIPSTHGARLPPACWEASALPWLPAPWRPGRWLWG